MGYTALIAYTLWQRDKNMTELSFDSELSLNLSQCTLIGHDEDVKCNDDYASVEGDHKVHTDIDSSTTTLVSFILDNVTIGEIHIQPYGVIVVTVAPVNNIVGTGSYITITGKLSAIIFRLYYN